MTLVKVGVRVKSIRGQASRRVRGVLHKKTAVGELVQVIESSDNWKELVRRKIVRFKQEAEGKIQGTAYTLLNVRGLNKGYVEFLAELQKRLT
jgi:predicted RNA-binding protein with EMAP domain